MAICYRKKKIKCESLIVFQIIPFHTNLNSLHPRMICAKFGWNWLSGFRREDTIVKSFILWKHKSERNFDQKSSLKKKEKKMNTICISISLWVAQGRGLEVNEATKIHCLCDGDSPCHRHWLKLLFVFTSLLAYLQHTLRYKSRYITIKAYVLSHKHPNQFCSLSYALSGYGHLPILVTHIN